MIRDGRKHLVRKVKGLVSRGLGHAYTQAVVEYRDAILGALPNKPSLHLLDVGCDDGEWTMRIAERMGIPSSQVHGIEIVDDRRALAVERGIDVRSADIEHRWPFEDETVDVVHANQVIEHVKRLEHFVGEARRVLRPGGACVICTENLASWPNVFSLMLGFMPFSLVNISNQGAVGNPLALHQHGGVAPGESWQHIHVVTLRALREIFEAQGFVVEREFGSGYFPAFGALGRSLAVRSPKRAHFIGLAVRRPV